MLPLHCGRCGRLIGRAEKRELEGETVCARCFTKLGGDQSDLTPKQTMAYIVGLTLAGAVVLGGAIFFVNWLVERLAE